MRIRDLSDVEVLLVQEEEERERQDKLRLLQKEAEENRERYEEMCRILKRSLPHESLELEPRHLTLKMVSPFALDD